MPGQAPEGYGGAGMVPKTMLAFVVAAASVLVTALAPSSEGAAVSCPKMDPTLTTDRILWGSGLREVSGIQASLDHPGVLWIIEDSGNGPYLHAYSVLGDRLATYTLTGSGLKNVDWEAIGLGRRSGTDVLIIGDIGDNPENRNGSARQTPALYELPEPSISASQSPAVVATIGGVVKFPFRYFADDGRTTLGPRDAESLFVDPRSHNVIILWKHLTKVDEVSKVSRVFQLAAQDLVTGTLNRAVHIADVVGAGDGVGMGPVAADIATDGEWIVVKNYSEGFLWRRARGQSIGEALRETPVAPCAVVVDAAESLTFAYNDKGVWIGFLSLREDPMGSPPLHQVQRAWV